MHPPILAEPWATNAAGRARLVGQVGAVHRYVPHLDAITAVMFRGVESLVGAIDESGRAQSTLRLDRFDSRDADRCSDHHRIIAHVEPAGFEPPANARGNPGGVPDLRSRKNDADLFAAVTSRDVIHAAAVAKHLADGSENAITGAVAERVVNSFEVIDVHHDH